MLGFITLVILTSLVLTLLGLLTALVLQLAIDLPSPRRRAYTSPEQPEVPQVGRRKQTITVF